MSNTGVFITSLGIISPVGQGLNDTLDAIRKATRGIKPLHLFPTSHTPPLPVGEVGSFSLASDLPRTHALALVAAEEAMKHAAGVPDAVVIGVTTGGMPFTEELLKRGELDSKQYEYHSTGSVAECVARHVGCTGPVLTVSTACSSGAVALKIALEMLRSGMAKRVLAGGADALCRLTYYGFHALQLVDEAGARPFDRNRRGMSVGEGAAILLLTSADDPPDNAMAELLGAGLSCDAYHPAAPHPEGTGALRAMKDALSDACLSPADIEYIQLHGTGTLDNDLAEAKAIHALFGERPIPPLSSIKGSVGHSLGAAGAMGAAVSVLSIAHDIIPANAGFHEPDPQLNLIPVRMPTVKDINTALVNSFGFGGNNAVLAVGHPRRRKRPETPVCADRLRSFTVLGSACLTAAGGLEQTIDAMRHGKGLPGIVSFSEIVKPLSEKYVRRLKRFPRMALSLAVSACGASATDGPPSSVFLGTGWGGLSETYDLLMNLFASGERFASPTDFVGSVHNAAAGHVAVHFKSTGPNVTMTGGDCSFEQALFSACLLIRRSDKPLLVIGADEHHKILSPLFDASVLPGGPPSDGGGALCLKPATPAAPRRVCPSFMAYSPNNDQVILALIRALGGNRTIREQFGAVMAGIPAAQRARGTAQLEEFLSITGYPHPVIDYRRFVGEFASASAVATVLAVSFIEAGEIPENICDRRKTPLRGRGVLILGFGHVVTAVEVVP
ncbi:MAG: beta-ketoacyl synthase chain length factor [Deltaproteobacteria bacterium]|nr:beta-ketoacyl synthase chain length factor [Deltaproteobacteria bacterium]